MEQTKLDEICAFLAKQLAGEGCQLQEELSRLAHESLLEAFRRHPGRFLVKHGAALLAEHLAFFEALHDQEVDLCLREIRRLSVHENKPSTIRNRRYLYMQKCLENTDYFSEETMKERDPKLYDEYIGRFLSDAEIAARARTAQQQTLSSHLMTHLMGHTAREEQEEANAAAGRDNSDDSEEGNDNEDEEEEDDEDVDVDPDETPALRNARELLARVQRGDGADQHHTPRHNEEQDSAKASISEEEKQGLRYEHLRLMQERFLRGEDQDFDYRCCDRNQDLEITSKFYERDLEDAYFDEDDD